MQLILASQSPRRRELLTQMGFSDFMIRPAQGEEVIDPALTPGQLVEALSRQKAAEVAHTAPDAVVIAADTVVTADGRVLGKPQSKEDAAAMLRFLSGRTHTVYTGVTVQQNTQISTQHEATQVRFRPLTQEEISAYIASREPMDKAGAYGIQEEACVFVKELKGEYYNVVGLPVTAVYEALKEMEAERT